VGDGEKMNSRYQIMRALLKRKCVRDVFWYVFRVFKFISYRQFLAELVGKHSDFFYKTKTVESVVSGVRKNGGIEGPSLSNDVVDLVYDYAMTHKCFADRDAKYGFMFSEYDSICKSLGKEVLVAQYFNVNDSLPIVRQLSEDPYLLEIATQYLKAAPKLVGVNLWWTFPVEASVEDKNKHAHVFHYDLDDVKFIKFFFYITDVSENDGPHVYVKESNRRILYKNTWIRSKRFSDQEVIDAYGEKSIVEVTGPAGSCFIEDTITLHKGSTSIGKPRLLLQLQYAINDFGAQNDYR
jgi:hypothetical protein